MRILKWCVTFLYVLWEQSYDCKNWNVPQLLHVHNKKEIIWTRPTGLKVREGLHLKPKRCHWISLTYFVWDQFSESSLTLLTSMTSLPSLTSLTWSSQCWQFSMTSMTSILSIFTIFHDFNPLNLDHFPWLQWL